VGRSRIEHAAQQFNTSLLLLLLLLRETRSLPAVINLIHIVPEAII
jgi:hypothetical protein